MAIAIDASSQGQGAIGTTVTIAHTCTGTNLILVVIVTVQSGANPTVTYNSVSMTLQRSRISNPAIYVFTLAAPATGTNNIVVTKADSVHCTVGALSLSGAETFSAVNDAGNSTGDPSLTITTAKQKGYVIAGTIYTNSGGLSENGGGTSFAAQSISSTQMNCAYEAYAAGANITASWDSVLGNNEWVAAGIEIYEPATSLPGKLIVGQAVKRASFY